MLKQRVITAIVLIAVIGSGIIWLPAPVLAALFALLVLIAAWEWANMAGLVTVLSRLLFTGGCAILLALVGWYCQLFSHLSIERTRDILGLACLWWSIALLWVKTYPGSAAIWNSLLMRILMGLLTLVPAWLALVYLRQLEQGVAFIFILIALVAAADIGAYFVGCRWGRHKLAPAVSPGKSWEGFAGGLVASMLLSLLLWLVLGQEQLSWQAAITVAVFTVLASVLGDLLESMIKRERGIKDSGVILPGHGGMMDRLDSMTAAAPVFALSLILLG